MSNRYANFDLLFSPGVTEYLLHLGNSLGNVDMGLEIEFWRGAYNDPLVAT